MRERSGWLCRTAGFTLWLVGGGALAAETVKLSELNLADATQGWGEPQQDRSVGGAPLTIAGRRFTHGFGTHSIGRLLVELDGAGQSFHAWVGIDDEATSQGSVEFQVLGDDKLLWSSGLVRRGQPAKEVQVDLHGVKRLALVVTDGGDGYGNDHADWAEAVFTFAGAKPRTVAPVLRDWENYKLLGRNKEPAHAPLVACPDAATAKTIYWVDNDQRVKSSWYRSLNGTWKFHYAKNLAGRLPDFFEPGFDDVRWPTIQVPGNMELQGYGVPIYTNIPNPWSGGTPPFIPENEPNNTVGAYRHTFTVPPAWKGRPVFITFDGVFSFFYLWINGQQVGMSKESRTPAEFEITQYVRPGENRIAVEVFRWSDGSYLEDQDTWRLSGIYRDVYVWSPPPVFVRDVEVRTTLDAVRRDGQLQVSSKLRNVDHYERAVRLEAELLDADGRRLSTAATSVVKVPGGDGTAVAFSTTLPNPQVWTGETPHRYLLLLTLKDDGDGVLEVIPLRVGFRQVEIRDGQLLVNGRAILVKGVNRHEQDEEHGYAVTTNSMRRDIALMKQLNINAVRTCHYPDAPAWYDLCDEYGIYVAAECNIETHAVGDMLSKHPAWGAAYLDRAVRNVETHKNHPSIVLWSLGNESGNGVNMVSNYRWIKQRDPTRPVFYDPASFDENSDIVASMYMKPWDVAKYIEQPQKKPLILCEYAYARGNASGDLWSYWKTFYQGKSAQGAFIWDFQDRAIPQPAEADRNGRLLRGFSSHWVLDPDGQFHLDHTEGLGKPFWAYGGDFGPPGTPSDGNMCCNGIVGTDRRPHPGAWEVKHVYQDIHCRPVSLAERTIEIANYFTYTNLKDIADVAWRVTADGQELQRGQLPDLDLPPRERRTVTIPIKPLTPAPGVEYHLEMSFSLKARLPYMFAKWATRDHELAWDQFPLPDAAPKPVPAASPAPQLTQAGDLATVTGQAFTAAFDRAAGALVSLKYHGTELIHTPLRPNFWRAPVDNDRGYGFDNIYGVWKSAVKDSQVQTMTVEAQGQAVVARAVLKLPQVDATWETVYTVYGSGEIVVDASFQPGQKKLPKLPRLGLQMALPKGFERLQWLGPGPQETYADRKAARVGVYASTVDEQVVDYTRPSEMGNHVDVRWWALTNDQGTGLLAIGLPHLSVSALHYTAGDLDGPRHLYEIPRRDETWLHLDLRQLGVGGDDGWGAQPHEAFQIPCQPYRYRFRLRPFTKSDGDVSTLARQAPPQGE